MSDRTPLQLTIVDCPAEQARAVLDLIEEYGLHLEYVEDGQPGDDQLDLGLMYMDAEVRCGSATEIARHLQEVAPRASWEVWEDPAYEWLGDIFRFTPDLGLFSAECDAEGNPVFTDGDILRITSTDPTPRQLKAELGRLHKAALDELEKTNAGVYVTPTDPDES